MATILIVDDHEANRELLAALLGDRNHTTVEARDGEEGLAQARALHPDLIITDILMPAMDGYEFTRRLRQESAIASIPVIFYSAHYLMQEANELAAKCGVKYVVPKPVDREHLLRTVDAALGLDAPSAVPASTEDFDREHIRVLTDKVSQQAGEVVGLNARLELLIEAGRELNVAQDASRLVERYCRTACEITGATCVAAYLNGRAPVRFCSSGAPPADPDSACPTCGLGVPVADLLADSVSRRGRLSRDEEAAGCSADLPAVDSYLVVPVTTRTRTHGWLGLANKIGDSGFTAEDERLVTTLSAQLAVGYENSRLFEELKQRAEDLEREIVERRRAAERYRMVVERASDGIVMTDREGNYLEVNPRMLEMLGYTREQFLGLNLRDLIPKQDQCNDPIQVDLEPGKIYRKERRLRRRDGSMLEVEISFRQMEDGRIQEIVRDVAERKRLEAELRQAQKLEAVGRLAGGVAHDFNNILTVILGHCDLALSAMDTGDRRRREIESIRESGLRAADLTGRLLAFSRKQVLQPRVINANTALANLTRMLGRLISSNIEVATECDPDLWRTRVDPSQLDQVILNLAINARDAMPLGGKLTLQTANRRLGPEDVRGEAVPGEYVMLEVSDTGRGMDDETLSHLFEPFFTTKPQGKGTGLGLSTVYGIVRQSGGHISVSSELGRGTRMRVFLPRAEAAADTERRRDDHEPLPEGNETILLAEDDPHVRWLAATILVQQGYRVLEAADGQGAIAVAQQHTGQIHLLFTDLMMPKITGRELAAELRRSRPEMKLLLCSGYTDDSIAQQGVLDASIPFLQKPFTPRALAVKVRETLDAASPIAPAESRRSAKRAGRDDPEARYPV
ncbi:MAG TPA: response regulator [Bryobacteraceae bacterium]|nr:response regulator [Bryobacteraceae bacterium]